MIKDHAFNKEFKIIVMHDYKVECYSLHELRMGCWLDQALITSLFSFSSLSTIQFLLCIASFFHHDMCNLDIFRFSRELLLLEFEHVLILESSNHSS